MGGLFKRKTSSTVDAPQQKRFFCSECKHEILLQMKYCDNCGGEIKWPKKYEPLISCTAEG